MADRNSISGQVAHHPAAPAAVSHKVVGIDPGHDPQRRFPDWCWLLVERGSWYAQQRTLPAYAELAMVVINQFAQFTGIRAAGTF